ncbi:MAG: O-antigen ligase family protein [Bacteroidia bacterium]|nr:O-antigen ligase family protein [Bacteroidia bacterium]
MLAYFLPIKPQISTIAIVVSFILSLLFIKGDSYKSILHNKPALLLLLFYLMHIVALLYSDNLKYGFKDLEYKLSFIVFPLIFINAGNMISIKPIGIAFVLGCISAAIICWVNAYLNFCIQANPSYFFYTSFSKFMHPTYFGMYCNLAMLLIVTYNKNMPNKLVFVTILTAGCLTMVFIASRMASIVAIITMVAYSIHVFYKEEKLMLRYVVLALLIAVGFQIYISKYFNRYNELQSTLEVNNATAQVPSTSSSNSRILLWQYATDVWCNNVTSFVFGVGTGDIKDALQQVYIAKNFQRGINEHYNPHNQFLHTAVALGILGLAILLMIFIFGLTNTNILSKYFLIIVGLNALTESVLEVQSGIIFFCFFYMMFNTNNKLKQYDSVCTTAH